MARKPLIINVVQIETAEVGLNPTSTVLKKMVAEIRGIARGTTGRIVMWC
jgi:hypothetical protein